MRARPHGRRSRHRRARHLWRAHHRNAGAGRRARRRAAHEQRARVDGGRARDDPAARTTGTLTRRARREAPDEDPSEETLMAQNLKFNPASARRAVARKLAMQALYRWQVNSGPWQDVVSEFSADEDMRKADRGYFTQLITDICGGSDELDTVLATWMDRKPTELDPVERAVLWVGAHELRLAPDVPYRVVINEAVGLAKRFGATDSHKFVNAVLDAAAKELRPMEH